MKPSHIIHIPSCLQSPRIRFEAGLGEHGVTVLASPVGLDQTLGLFSGDADTLTLTPERVRVQANGRDCSIPADDIRWVKDERDFDNTPMAIWEWTMTPSQAFLLIELLLNAPLWMHDAVPSSLLQDEAWEGTLAGLCLPWPRFN